MSRQDNESHRIEVFSAGAEWFIAIGAFIYTTGFLVALLHADILGAPEISMDLFRTKYVLIGILCLALPTILTAAALGLWEVWRNQELDASVSPPKQVSKSELIEGSIVRDVSTGSPEQESKPLPIDDSSVRNAGAGPSEKAKKVRPIYASSVVLAINLLLTMYLFLLFAPRSSFRDRPHLIWWIFGATIVGILSIEFLTSILEKRLFRSYLGKPDTPTFQPITDIKENFIRVFRIAARWVLCAAIIALLDRYCFWDMRHRLLEILWPRHGVNFLLFVASLTFIVLRLRIRSDALKRVGARVGLWTVGWCVIVLLYILSVFAFAYTIYPQIPAGRGGGDYSDSPKVILSYAPSELDSIPQNFKQGNQSQPLILVEETTDEIVVADGDPMVWRNGSPDSAQKPAIVAINRKAITAVQFQPRNNRPIEPAK